jgi:hypothetical protein
MTIRKGLYAQEDAAPAAHLNRKNASKPKLLNVVNPRGKAHTHHIQARVEVVPALRGFRSGSCLAAEVVHPSWCF